MQWASALTSDVFPLSRISNTCAARLRTEGFLLHVVCDQPLIF